MVDMLIPPLIIVGRVSGFCHASDFILSGARGGDQTKPVFEDGNLTSPHSKSILEGFKLRKAKLKVRA